MLLLWLLKFQEQSDNTLINTSIGRKNSYLLACTNFLQRRVDITECKKRIMDKRPNMLIINCESN
jgi:hypothetical protein